MICDGNAKALPARAEEPSIYPRCLLRLARAGLDRLDLDLAAAHGVLDRLLVLLDPLAEGHLADHPRLFADRGLLAGAEHLDGLVLEHRLGLLRLQLAVRRPALDLDLFLAQGDGLLDRPLADAGGDPHPAARDLALADRELLLDLLQRLALLVRALAGAGLVALHDGGGLPGLLRRGTGGDHGLAAARRFGVAARIVLAEAALDDLGHQRVLVAVQDLDVLVLEAGLDQLVDQLLGDLGTVDRGYDRCC